MTFISESMAVGKALRYLNWGISYLINIVANQNVRAGYFPKIDYSVKIIVDSGGKLILGKNVRIKNNAIIYVKKNAILSLGDNTSIGHHSELSIAGHVSIGSNVITGAYFYLTDSNHRFEASVIPFRRQGMGIKSCYIGDNVWVGRAAMVLAGGEISNNSVIAANATVTKAFPGNVVLGGVPAKIIKCIEPRHIE